MNEEDTFKLDIEAEKEATSQDLDEDFKPSDLVHVMKDIPLPEVVFYTATESFKSSKISPQIAMQTVTFDVKVDAEQAYEKAEYAEKQIAMMNKGLQELAEGIQPNWLSVSNKDNFEERATVEPVNLIFEPRRDRMSSRPKWS